MVLTGRRAIACVSLLALAACSTAAKLGGAGATCLQATDCKEGLVCVPQSGGASQCSSDVSKIQLVEDAASPVDAAKRDSAASDGRAPDAMSGVDAGAPAADAGVGDAAAQADAATAPADDAAPSDDAAPPPDDAVGE